MDSLSNDNIVYIKEKDIEYIKFKRLLEYPEIVHCYTLKSNNFDVAGNDTMNSKKGEVIENYKKLSRSLEIDFNNIIRPYQTHTDIIKTINNKKDAISIFPKELTNVDGLLTDKKDIIFSLGYADCIPLFLYDPVRKVVGNIHSGWRGTLQKIGKKAVQKMIEIYKSDPKDIICCIGPSIRKCHFEVDEDVKELFYKEFSYTNRIDEIIQKNEKYNIDTVLINKIILEKIGLKKENIIDSNICSVCNSNLFHSYRADGKVAGRNTAIIGRRG